MNGKMKTSGKAETGRGEYDYLMKILSAERDLDKRFLVCSAPKPKLFYVVRHHIKFLPTPLTTEWKDKLFFRKKLNIMVP
jgi:hypothetical protein